MTVNELMNNDRDEGTKTNDSGPPCKDGEFRHTRRPIGDWEEMMADFHL
jgi:hypothetical protein